MGRLGVLTATTGALVGVLWAVVLASGFRHESESEWSDEPLEDEPVEYLHSRTTPSSIDGIAPSFLVAPQEPAHEHEHDVKDEEKGGTVNVADAREDGRAGDFTPDLPVSDLREEATYFPAIALESRAVSGIWPRCAADADLGIGARNSSESGFFPPLSCVRKFRALTLKNGVDVLLVQDPLAPRAALAVNFGVGSINKPEDLPGLNYLMQHTVWRGGADFRKLVQDQYGGGVGAMEYPDKTALARADFAPNFLDEVAAGVADYIQPATLTNITHDDLRSGIVAIDNDHKNMHLVIRATLSLNEMESVAKSRFGFERECSSAAPPPTTSSELPSGSQLQLDAVARADRGTEASTSGLSADGRCPAATEPAASPVALYRPPRAAQQERDWGEAFPAEKLGKEFLTKATERPEIRILFPIRIPDFDRKEDRYKLFAFLAYVFLDSDNSLQNVLKRESFVEDIFPEYTYLRPGSFVMLHLMLTDAADKSSERRALLWKTLFEWFGHLAGQTEDALRTFLEKIQ
eukprot:g15010.t1